MQIFEFWRKGDELSRFTKNVTSEKERLSYDNIR